MQWDAAGIQAERSETRQNADAAERNGMQRNAAEYSRDTAERNRDVAERSGTQTGYSWDAARRTERSRDITERNWARRTEKQKEQQTNTERSGT